MIQIFHVEDEGVFALASDKDYRNRLRVALAHELLAQTQLDIERVAERAGFRSARQLRRAWHKWYAAPPRASRPAAPPM